MTSKTLVKQRTKRHSHKSQFGQILTKIESIRKHMGNSNCVQFICPICGRPTAYITKRNRNTGRIVGGCKAGCFRVRE